MDREKYEKIRDSLEGLNVLSNIYDRNGCLTIYRKPYNATKILIDDDLVFDLDKVTYLSLDPYGLQLNYDGKLVSLMIDELIGVKLE